MLFGKYNDTTWAKLSWLTQFKDLPDFRSVDARHIMAFAITHHHAVKVFGCTKRETVKCSITLKWDGFK